MVIETVIGLPYQFAVEALFAPTRFVARHEQNSPALGIKSESHSPFTISRAEAQFLHVRMAGPVECVSARASQLWPKLFENERQCQNLRLHIFVQRVELRLKLIGHINGPFHTPNMIYNTLCSQLHICRIVLEGRSPVERLNASHSFKISAAKPQSRATIGRYDAQVYTNDKTYLYLCPPSLTREAELARGGLAPTN